MTVIKPQEPGHAPQSETAADPQRESAAAASRSVIPFPGAEARRTRRIPCASERRGEILLSLGVRYERLAS